MRSDSKQVADASPDLSPLLGTWINTNPNTDYISKLIVSSRSDRIFVHVYGSHTPTVIDWGEVEATPYMTSGTVEAVGFNARYDFGEIETLLASNQKLGILVIQSYTSFKDASGRMNHFSREFFHK
jgi:hypothetical protein